MSVHVRRRVVALVVLLALGAGAAALLVLSGDDGDSASTATATTPRETSLVAALAPLLEGRAPVSGTSSPEQARGGGSGGGSAGSRGAGSNLGLSPVRAAARLFVVGFAGTSADAPFVARLATREWGGVVLDAGNAQSPEQVSALVAAVRGAAREAGNPVPLVAVRQAGGADSEIEGLPPLAQSRQTSAAAAESEARQAGRRLRELGIGLTLAPDADLAYEGGPWAQRSFSEEVDVTTSRVRAALRGYRATGVAAAVGHFPGEGAASQDPRLGTATVGLGLDELRRSDVRPFAAVARQAPVIAMTEALYAAFDSVTPATLLPEAVALLRDTGFRGAVLSGDISTAAFAAGIEPGEAAVEALRAGCDMLLLRGDARDQEKAVQAVARAIRSGDLPAGRVREALRRAGEVRTRYAREPLVATAPVG